MGFFFYIQWFSEFLGCSAFGLWPLGVCFLIIRASPSVSKKYQYLKLYFALKNNFLRFSLKLKGFEPQ